MSKQFRIFLIVTALIIEVVTIAYYIQKWLPLIQFSSGLNRVVMQFGGPNLWTYGPLYRFFLPEILIASMVLAQFIYLVIKRPTHPRSYVYPTIIVILFVWWRLNYFGFAGVHLPLMEHPVIY